MKKVLLLMFLAIVINFTANANSIHQNEAFYQMLNKLLEEQKYPQYYAEAFMGLCNDWKNTKLMFYVADGYDKLGDLYREKNMLLRILTLTPEDKKAKERLEKIEKSIERIEQKIKTLHSKPASVQTYTQLAAIYIGLKNLSKARYYLNKANLLDPGKKNIVHNLMAGAFDKQIDLPTKQAISLANQATIEYDKGNKEKAMRMFKDALSLSIISPFVYDNLGKVLVKEGNYGGAIRAFEEELAINPDAPTAVAIGNLYYILKDYNTAFSYFQKATKLNGMASEAYYNIALCLEKLGDKEGAKQYYKMAFSQNPKLKESKKNNTLFIKGIEIKKAN